MRTKNSPVATRRSKSRQEIAEEYGISRRTLYRWIQRTDIQMPPGLIPPKVQEQIYEEFGDPNKPLYLKELTQMHFR